MNHFTVYLKKNPDSLDYVVFDKVNRLEENEYIRFNKKKGLEVSTIDKYQGRDKETIILSMARSNDAGKTGRLLEDKRRLNVAFSRTKMKLIIIGSYKTLFVGSLVVCSILQEITCTVEGGLNICPRILASCTNIPIKTKPINAASTQSENLD